MTLAIGAIFINRNKSTAIVNIYTLICPICHTTFASVSVIPNSFCLVFYFSQSCIKSCSIFGWVFFCLLGVNLNIICAIVNTLNREINRALLLPDVRERLVALGTEVAGGTPEQLAKAVADEVSKWARLVKDRNLKFD